MRVPSQRYEHKDGRHCVTGEPCRCQVALDPNLDSSGWTAGALNVMMRLSSALSYEKAVEVSRDFEMLPGMSRASLERLTQPYAKACQAQTRELLDTTRDAPLLAGRGRKVVLEVDGVRVLEKAQDGVCGGIEIKSAVIHPVSAPQQRALLADVCEATAFTDQVAGLMREAGLRQTDEVVGLSDGASWIKNLYEHLGIPHIIDVYHSSSYLDTLMEALAWDEPQRATTRAQWLRGEIDAAAWLDEHTHDSNLRFSQDEPT